MRGGSSYRLLEPSNGTRGLWSVSTWNVMPTRKSEKCLHAHVIAKASFSICAYLFSVSVSALEIYATGLRWPSSCLWSSTAPSPNDDVSAETTVSALVVSSAPLWCCWMLFVDHAHTETCFASLTGPRVAVSFMPDEVSTFNQSINQTIFISIAHLQKAEPHQSASHRKCICYKFKT